MAKIAVLGPLNIDMIVHGTAPESMIELNDWVGLSNVSVLMAGAVGYFIGISKALGHEISVFSVIGNDPMGGLVLDSLKRLGCSTNHVDVQNGKFTAIAIYMLLFGSKKRPLTYQEPTHDLWPLSFSSSDLEEISTAEWFHHGGYLHFPPSWDGSVLHAFRYAKKAGLKTSLDPQFPLSPYNPPWIEPLKPLLPFVNVLFVDKIESCNLVGIQDHVAAAKKLSKMGPEFVIVKLGPEGSMLINRESSTPIYQDAIPVDKIVDSIGAGDAFDAGFIDGIISGKDHMVALEHASRVASRTLSKAGGSF